MNLRNKLAWYIALNSYVEATVTGVPPLSLIKAKAKQLKGLIAFGGTEFVAETYIDTVTAEGKCEQVDSLDPTAVPTPAAPIDIVCNNGALKVYRNMWNMSSPAMTYATPGFNVAAAVISSDGTFSVPNNSGNAASRIQLIMSASSLGLVDGKTYTIKIWVVGDNDFNTDRDSTVSINGQNFSFRQASPISYTWTQTGGNGITVGYLYFVNYAVGDTASIRVQVSEIESIGDYLPYGQNQVYTDGTQETITDNVGNVANCQMLLSVGTYTDEQELISGAVTRNVGIKVLDGTETWTQTTTNVVEAAIMTGQQYGETAMCSHLTYSSAGSFGSMADNSLKTGTATYQNKIYCKSSDYATDTTTWKAFLSAQYAAGTPVIIVYPLATATTETVTGQILTKAPVIATGSLTGLVATAVSSSHTTPKPYEPLDINCNNGVLKYGNVSKNLFDEVYPEPTASIKYIPLYLGPGTYTCSYSMPARPLDASMVYFLNGSVSAGANNGANQVDASTPRTVTSTDGYVTVAYRTGNGVGLTGAVPSDYNCMIESGSFATAYEPYKLDVYTDGTVETINVHGKNLFNKDGTLANGYYKTSDGVWIENAAFRTQDYIKASPNTNYALTVTNLQNGGNYLIMSAWDSEHNWLGTVASTAVGGDAGTSETITGTTPPDAFYLSVSFAPAYRDINTLQIEKGSTATTYEPYYDGGTATAEMLLSVNDYTDQQEIIDGTVTRKVGIKVLDGTENWLYNSNYSRFNIGNFLTNSLATTSFLITHGVSGSQNHNWRILANNTLAFYDDLTWYADATAFKTWLATQYANGTPVIIVYPLDTATTESVAGQPMSTTAGDNTVEITQASMDGLELSVKYLKQA